jgi:transposase-like protein
MAFRFAVKAHKCPRCSSALVRRSHKKSIFEHIACRFLFVQPHRCDDCDLRFFTFGTRSARKLAHP